MQRTSNKVGPEHKSAGGIAASGKKKNTSRSSDLLAGIEELVASALRANLPEADVSAGQVESLAVETGRAVSEHLRVHFAGQLIYIPFDRQRRDAALFDAFTGENHLDLAAIFQVSLNTVYKIIRSEAHRRRLNQDKVL